MKQTTGPTVLQDLNSILNKCYAKMVGHYSQHKTAETNRKTVDSIIKKNHNYSNPLHLIMWYTQLSSAVIIERAGVLICQMRVNGLSSLI